MQEWQAISVIKEEHINKKLETFASIDLNYYWIEHSYKTQCTQTQTTSKLNDSKDELEM